MTKVILIGGASGVGTSTVANELSKRHGITHVIETDYLREVLRTIISRKHSPILHKSSYNAFEILRDYGFYIEGFDLTDLVTLGYLWHISPIISTVTSIIKRAYQDRENLIIEGVHLCPGSLNLSKLKDKIDIVFFILDVDKDTHYQRFLLRSKHKERDTERHLRYFEHIRITQEFLIERAKRHNIPVIPNYDIEYVMADVEKLVSR
jgi:hypothetical protein